MIAATVHWVIGAVVIGLYYLGVIAEWWWHRERRAMTNALIRAARTFAQVAVGVYLAGLTAPDSLEGLADLGLIEAAVSAGVVAVISFGQNWLEESAASYNRG
jgi:uncharacterized membrane protein AbrB (regulator of aidB expression)